MQEELTQKAYQRRARKDYNSVGIAFIWQYAFVLIAQLGIGLIYRFYGVLDDQFMIYFFSVAQNIIPFGYFAYKHRESIQPFFRLRSPIRPLRILGGSVFALGSNVLMMMVINIVVLILVRFGLEPVTPDFALEGSFWQQVFLVFFMVVGAPVTEEILYRGMLYPVLRKYGTSFGIIASSLLFSLSHGNLQQAVPTFFVGLTLAYVTEMSGSIYEAIGIHMINNILALITGELPSELTSLFLLLLIPGAIAVFAVFVSRGTKPGNNPQVPSGARWPAFWTSPAVLICLLLMVSMMVWALIGL